MTTTLRAMSDSPRLSSLAYINKNMKEYEVIVGNVGKVHSGTNKREAVKCFNEYVDISDSGNGRAGYEDVVLMEGGEPIKEHWGTAEMPPQGLSKD